VGILELCLFLALACCSCSAAPADRTITQFAHTSWGPKDGAPSPVTALAQTSDGYLWLGSLDGLYRFDGVAFERYQPQSGGPFPHCGALSLLALPNGDLWIGFSCGVVSLLRNGNATNYTPRSGLPGAMFALAQDREGTIWAGTDSGLVRLEGNRWKEVGKDWNFPGGPARTVFLDRQGTLWVSTEDSLTFLPAGTRRFQPAGIRVGQVSQIAQAPNGKLWMAETTRSVRPIPLSDNRQPPDDTEVRVGSVRILFDNDGALWITTVGDGLRRSRTPELLRGRIGEFSTAVESFTAKNGLSDDVVRTVLQDREGNIWVGTNKGLDRFRKTNLVSVLFPFKISNGNLWAAGDAGDLWIEDVSPMVHVHEGQADPHHVHFLESAISAYRDPAGAIWWFCPFALYRYHAGSYTRVPLPPPFPKPYTEQEVAMTEDRSGTLWLAAVRDGLFSWSNGRWQRLEAASEFAKLIPTTAFTDWMGRAWFGYKGGTIIIVDQGKIQRVFHPNDSPVGSIGVIQGRGQHLWVGGESGLAFFDGNRFRRIIPADPETFGSIGAIEEAPNGSLWLSESRGLIEIPATEVEQALRDPAHRVKYRIFDSSDGVPGISPKLIQSTDGKIWLSSSDGIAWVDPARIFSNALPPPVLIRSVKANGKQISSLTNLVLPPRTTDLQISYTALSLSVPEKVRFRYRLQGVDKDWQDAGTRREAFYTRLGPGTYHFRVIACNNDGVWNEEGARLDFRIAPAWYQTIWFRAFCVLAFFALLWGVYQMRVRRLREQEKTFREAVETMPALAFIADPKGNRTFMNKGWIEYTGLSPEEPSASGWEKTIHPDDLQRIAERWRASEATGQPLDYEARLRRSDGVYRWFLIRAVPVRDKHGKIVKWCGAATDIEDRKRAEQLQADLTHASRVSTMGQLVASISHELAQPITATTNNAKASLRWLQHDPPDLSQVRKGTQSIIEAGTFAAEIIDRLRSLYKKSAPRRELVAINEVIGEMARMMRSKAREDGVSIRTDLTDDLPLTLADRVQLQQVLMNLMLNGIEAMKDTGGVLVVRSQLAEDGKIEISVMDIGPGLPPGDAEQIFDAFFTTKPEGSGMGLAISKSIVESLGGRIWASNGDGGGATFHFTLPAAPVETNSPVDAT
jgi:PAS domain S-box-containing protein